MRSSSTRDEALRELSAAISETECAVLAIIKAVEAILTHNLQDEHAIAATQAQCVRILEACTFQDIVGQRLAKLQRMHSHSRSSKKRPSLTVVASEPRKDKKDAGLLNGPAPAGEGLTQEMVEKLLLS